MKYLLLAYAGETARELNPEECADLERHVVSWIQEMTDRGVRLLGSRPSLYAFAATVRPDGDELMFTDGPFAEAKEQMTGFESDPY